MVFWHPRARLVVAERHALHAPDQVGQRRVLDEVLEELAVRGADEGHAALGDRAARRGFFLRADLVHDDDLRRVVLHRLDHHPVLLRGVGHLHAPRAADGGVRHVPVAADLVARVDDHHALAVNVAQHARELADDGGLPHAGPPEKQDGLAAFGEKIFDHVDVPL